MNTKLRFQGLAFSRYSGSLIGALPVLLLCLHARPVHAQTRWQATLTVPALVPQPNDAHVTFAGTAGTINTVTHVAGPVPAAIGGAGNQVDIDWGAGAANKVAAATVYSFRFSIGGAGPVSFGGGTWTNDGNVVAAMMGAQVQVQLVSVDLLADALGRTREGLNVQPVQTTIDAPTNRVALSCFFRIKNPDPDGGGPQQAAPIFWGFPVKEDPATPWVMNDNGGNFSGLTRGLNHAHNVLMNPNILTDPAYYGPHPHAQLYLFKQPGGAGPLVLIGCSDLKHTFATVHGGVPDSPHFLVNDENDTYNNNSNADRNFYGPVAEMDANTFEVVDHDHLGSFVANELVAGRVFKTYERDHGEPNEADDFVHRLQTDSRQLRTAAQGGDVPNNTKWFFGASFFVFDPSIPGKELNRKNNTILREFNPGWNGANFVPTWTNNDDGVRIKDDGTMSNLVPPDQDGLFFGPSSHPCAPPPAECWLFVGRGSGDALVTVDGVTFQTQMQSVNSTYEVTMTDFPAFPLPARAPGSHGLWKIDRPMAVSTQVVMYNPEVFPANPSQWSQRMAVYAAPNEQPVVTWHGTRNGIHIGWSTYYGPDGKWYIQFPFAIDKP